MECSVRLWNFQPSMLHAKIMTIDGVAANVGSANFNSRSTKLDEEINLVAFDPGLVRVLDAHFEEDLERSVAIGAGRWGATLAAAARVRGRGEALPTRDLNSTDSVGAGVPFGVSAVEQNPGKPSVRSFALPPPTVVEIAGRQTTGRVLAAVLTGEIDRRPRSSPVRHPEAGRVAPRRQRGKCEQWVLLLLSECGAHSEALGPNPGPGPYARRAACCATS